MRPVAAGRGGEAAGVAAAPAPKSAGWKQGAAGAWAGGGGAKAQVAGAQVAGPRAGSGVVGSGSAVSDSGRRHCSSSAREMSVPSGAMRRRAAALMELGLPVEGGGVG